jgi:hypothetical protein
MCMMKVWRKREIEEELLKQLQERERNMKRNLEQAKKNVEIGNVSTIR